MRTPRCGPNRRRRRGSFKLSRGAKKGVAFPVFARSTSFKLRDDPHRPISGEPMSKILRIVVSCLVLAGLAACAPPPPRQSSPRRPPSRSTPRPSSRTICEGRAPAPRGLVHALDLVAGTFPRDAANDTKLALAAPLRLRRMRPAERRALRVAAGLRFALSSSAKTRAQFCHRMREEQVAKLASNAGARHEDGDRRRIHYPPGPCPTLQRSEVAPAAAEPRPPTASGE